MKNGRQRTPVAPEGREEADRTEAPRCLGVSSQGLKTSAACKATIEAVILDVLNDRISTKKASITIGGISAIARIADMERRQSGSGKPETIQMIGEPTNELADRKRRLIEERSRLDRELAEIEAA